MMASGMQTVATSQLNFSALSPDGALLFGDSGGMINSSPTVSQLYDLTAVTPGTPLTVSSAGAGTVTVKRMLLPVLCVSRTT